MQTGIKTVVKFNHLSGILATIDTNAALAVERAAEGLRDQMREDLNCQVAPIASDPGALATSLSVQSEFGSDYSERVDEAKEKYLGESAWKDAVRKKLGVGYTGPHFDARVADEATLPDFGGDIVTASVTTPLVYGFYWEFGHENQFTGKYEHRPWMGPQTAQFRRKYAQYFRAMFKRGVK
jgi:hypothetical protein